MELRRSLYHTNILLMRGGEIQNNTIRALKQNSRSEGARDSNVRCASELYAEEDMSKKNGKRPELGIVGNSVVHTQELVACVAVVDFVQLYHLQQMIRVTSLLMQHTAAHCNTATLQYTAIHCNTLQDTATHCKTLQHTATHCNTLQHTAIHLLWCSCTI